MCDCNTFEKWCEGTREDNRFEHMEQLKIGNWCYLVKCLNCEQLWQVDAWDKGSHGLAIKYDGDISNWERMPDKEILIEIITQNHGGVSNRKCQWSGCNNNALANMVFCSICAYEKMGVRW